MAKPYFLIKKSRHEAWHFVLKAANGETIATSEMYSGLQSCKHGIDAVKNCAPDAEIRYDPEHPPG